MPAEGVNPKPTGFAPRGWDRFEMRRPAAVLEGKEEKRRRAAALQRGLASSGREGPVFPPEPRSRCRGREGREV